MSVRLGRSPKDVRCAQCLMLGAPHGAWRKSYARNRPGATSLPFVANVVTREHVLLDDLDDDGHAELGRLVARTYAAVQALNGVGNVHITKWENGSGHFSMNVMARPRGVLQLRGSNLPIWADMLPNIPQDEYDERAAAVRAALA